MQKMILFLIVFSSTISQAPIRNAIKIHPRQEQRALNDPPSIADRKTFFEDIFAQYKRNKEIARAPIVPTETAEL